MDGLNFGVKILHLDPETLLEGYDPGYRDVLQRWRKEQLCASNGCGQRLACESRSDFWQGNFFKYCSSFSVP